MSRNVERARHGESATNFYYTKLLYLVLVEFSIIFSHWARDLVVYNPLETIGRYLPLFRLIKKKYLPNRR